jgi:hypothetical protein
VPIQGELGPVERGDREIGIGGHAFIEKLEQPRPLGVLEFGDPSACDLDFGEGQAAR